MSILGVEATFFYHSGCHGDHIMRISILGLSVIYHPMCVLPFGVHCCLHNSLLFHFIVQPLIEDPATVLIGCEHGFLGNMLWGFSLHCVIVYDTCLLQYKT